MTDSSELSAIEDRVVFLGDGCAALPERLLLQHAAGRVLLISGAGTSLPSGLPSFRDLALEVYKLLDRPVHDVLIKVPIEACNQWKPNAGGLLHHQRAEVRRFVSGEYDVVLGMLERRIDGTARQSSEVRSAIANVLQKLPGKDGGKAPAPKPCSTHRALMRLADRGSAVTIATTNFDLLLEMCRRRGRVKIQTRSLGAIPRPGLSAEFSGVLHIHGTCFGGVCHGSELVVTDQDFGEYYLRRRVVPDFIYDAARLFNIVLVGYSASDAPMRYLLNAVAADGSRFGDLRERFAFVATDSLDNEALLEDWRGRGITPIPYKAANNHQQLTDTLTSWADLSPIVGDAKLPDRLIRRLTRTPRAKQSDANRDLVEYLIRRSNPGERQRLIEVAIGAGAERQWLDAFIAIGRDVDRKLLA